MTKIAIALLVATAGLAFPKVANAQEQNAVVLGARAWARNCTRCHNARASTERTDRQWDTIIAHMRARGNLTKAEATNITEYLKATNAPEAVVVSSGAVPVPEPRVPQAKADSAGQPPAKADPGKNPEKKTTGGG